jgi:two-component system sensor histidine kinase SenX3
VFAPPTDVPDALLLRALEVVGHSVFVYEASDLVYANSAGVTLLERFGTTSAFGQTLDGLVAKTHESGSCKHEVDITGANQQNFSVSTDLRDGFVILVVEDTTERRRLEKVRRDFVANISHELKTPVGALSLLAETIVGETDPVTVARLSERMQVESQRVADMIEDLLSLARLEAEETPNLTVFSVYDMARDAVARLQGFADHRQVSLDVMDLTAQSPLVCIAGDRRQFLAALQNLVENGIKYSEIGAAVAVSIAAVDDCVEISVVDHGSGIPDRDLDRIFERFYRVDRARARDTGGTGLGLAIVRHVVRNHGGDVSVRSQEGVGSTFVIRMPRAIRVPLDLAAKK